MNINTNAIKNSIVDGKNTDTIAVIPTDNLTRSSPFTFEPLRPLYSPVSSNQISEMRFTVTDSLKGGGGGDPSVLRLQFSINIKVK